MRFSIAFACGLFLAAAAGCGGKKPDAAVGSSAAPGSGAPSTLPAAGSPATKPAIASQAPESSLELPTSPTHAAPSSAGDDLRSLAARLVEKGPQGNWRISEAAALELEKREDGPEELAALLCDSQTEVRRGTAFYLLAKFDPADEKQVAGYSELLEDSEPFLRSLGLQAVRKMYRADQISAVPRLAGMLSPKQETSPENRAALARLLGNLKQEAAPALEGLVAAAAEDESPNVRGACLVAISQIAPAEEALPAYRAGLADKEPSVRLVAAARLRQAGKAAAPAKRELAEALEDADPAVREAAAEALVLIGKEAVSAISKHLDSKLPPTRQLSIACLGKIGKDAKSALPLVEKRLTDEDPDVRKVAEAVMNLLKD